LRAAFEYSIHPGQNLAANNAVFVERGQIELKELSAFV